LNYDLERSMKKYQKKPIAVIPRPKYLKFSSEDFLLTKETQIVAGKSSFCREEAQKLKAGFREVTGLNLPVVSKVQPKRNVKAIVLESAQDLAGVANKEEGYTLRVTTDFVTLKACTGRGLFYAIQSLIGLIEKKENRWIILSCEIKDWPDFTWRGFMADPAREFIPLSRLKEYIRSMAYNKLNILHVHFADAESFTIETKSYPQLNRTTHKGYHGVYSKKEVKELISYADEYKIEIIPEIDIPGHSTHILKLFPELHCQPKKGKLSNWTMCVGSEKTYQFLDQLFSEIVPLFPSKYFHIGTDELEFKDDIDNVFISWRQCRVCQELMKKEGLRNIQELFYYFLRRVQRILKKHGKQMMIWNDNIDIAKPHNVPKDVLIHFWRVAAPGRGPRKNCSLAKFLKDGFQVVNSYYPETYFNYIQDYKLARWHPVSKPLVPAQFQKAVLGGEMCAWEYGWKDYCSRVLPPIWAMFADRVWNKKKISNLKTFARALPKHIFGPQVSPELNSLFEVLGSIRLPLPNKKWKVTTTFPLELSQKEKKKIYQTMERDISRELQAKKVLNLSALQQYLECIRSLRKE